SSTVSTVPGSGDDDTTATATRADTTDPTVEPGTSGGPGPQTGESTSDSTGDGTGVPGTTGDPGPLSFTVVTFNTGTTLDLNHDGDGDAYGQDQADLSDQYYGDGLAWQANVDQTAAFFAALQPDVVVFQEIFYSGECPRIPPSAYPGFVCETWQPGDPTVVELVMGSDYQIACNLGRPDKCTAVRKEFGTIVGCEQDLCLDGLDGVPIDGCGGGSRVGRALIELPDGQQLTLATVHGTSGLLPDDWNCREAQVEQIFVDFDGEPAANGRRNLVMGDLNTDPYRAFFDPSADRWLDFVGDGEDFDFISEAGPTATPTYSGLLNIDHVISDHFVGDGECRVPGITPGEPAVLGTVYFDHRPIVCDVTAR
ncbi:MAG: hypothetical protein AB1Z98_38460, partial [Nannocystaceae bacterium]